MKPPMFRECVCGHLGSRHREDGTCAACECERFTKPTRSYARAAGVPVAEEFRRVRKTMGTGPGRER